MCVFPDESEVPPYCERIREVGWLLGPFFCKGEDRVFLRGGRVRLEVKIGLGRTFRWTGDLKQMGHSELAQSVFEA